MEEFSSPRLAWVTPGDSFLAIARERGKCNSAFEEIFINQKRKPHSSYQDAPWFSLMFKIEKSSKSKRNAN